MEELHYRIIERLRQNPQALSRNRNFHVFDDPSLLRARRIYRHLRSLERDLLTPGGASDIRVEPDPLGVKISFWLKTIRGRRTAFLTQRELDLLLDNPQIRALLFPVE